MTPKKRQTMFVAEADDGQRLDRYLIKHIPQMNFVSAQKLLRKGDIKVDGKKAKANLRLEKGQEISIPPFLQKADPDAPVRQIEIPHKLREQLKQSVLFEDDEIIVFNKWSGLAVQGGSNTKIHVDGIAATLWPKPPKLVHRLDKDTSGLLLMAKSGKVAAQLTRAFADKTIAKVYWAIVCGVPRQKSGIIDLPMMKKMSHDREKVEIDEENGEEAITEYRVLDQAGKDYALMELRPVTGRTHQLRVHCAAIHAPILGDQKYGEKVADDRFPTDLPLLLHAKSIALPHSLMGALNFHAPLPDYFTQALATLDLRGK